MVWSYFANLIECGNGYVFLNLLANLLVSLVVCILTAKVVVPAIKSYRLSKAFDKSVGTDSKHWFYGHVIKYGFTGEGMKNLSNLYVKFPSSFNRWFGPLHSTLHFLHPDTTVSVLGSGAPKNKLSYYFLRAWLGDGLLTSSGKKWHRNRRLLTPAFHYRILRRYNKVFNSCTSVLVGKWKNQVGKPVDVIEPLCLLTLDTMMQCAMSQKTDCQSIRERHPYIEAVHELSTCLMYRFTKPYLLLDWIFYKTKNGKRFKNAADILHRHTEQIEKQRRGAIIKESNLKENVDDFGEKMSIDFLEILLQTTDEDGKGLTDREIRDEVDTFLFEGHDTTASALSWTIYNLAKHSDLQQKCRDEIILEVGDKNNVEWEDLSKLKYVTMFIKESMRLYSPVPFIARQLNKPLQLSHSKTPEQVIPAETNVTVNIFAQHRNGHVWEKPLVFNPERFCTQNIANRSPHAYIPFSAGSRNCIGQNFAMNEMKVVVSQLLRNFHFYLDEDTPQPIPTTRLVLKSENGIFVKFTNRGTQTATGGRQ